MYLARDIMTKGVVAISWQTTASDAIRILLENNISGAPVVDDDGTVIGIISEFKLMSAVFDPGIKRTSITQIMSTDVIYVTEFTGIDEVARIFQTHRIRRVPVLRNRKVVGVVSRPDLLRFMQEDNFEACARLLKASQLVRQRL